MIGLVLRGQSRAAESQTKSISAARAGDLTRFSSAKLNMKYNVANKSDVYNWAEEIFNNNKI